MARRRWQALLAAALACFAVRAARADGAFPDSQTILTPATHPDEIVLVTNFGLIITEDGGANWVWSCERDVNAFGVFYQQSASRQRLFAVANDALIFSDDFTCGWTVGGGLLSGQTVLDAFVDRAVTVRVLAVGSHCCAGDQHVYTAFESMDAGGTFGRALYQAASG